MLRDNPVLPPLMINELTILQKSSHPNIMIAKELLEDNDNFYIVTELLEGGELWEKLMTIKHYCESKAGFIIKQVL